MAKWKVASIKARDTTLRLILYVAFESNEVYVTNLRSTKNTKAM